MKLFLLFQQPEDVVDSSVYPEVKSKSCSVYKNRDKPLSLSQPMSNRPKSHNKKVFYYQKTLFNQALYKNMTLPAPTVGPHEIYISLPPIPHSSRDVLPTTYPSPSSHVHTSPQLTNPPPSRPYRLPQPATKTQTPRPPWHHRNTLACAGRRTTRCDRMPWT